MHYGHNCHMGYGYDNPSFGYGDTFVLIVVLFILLIIIGTSYVG